MVGAMYTAPCPAGGQLLGCPAINAMSSPWAFNPSPLELTCQGLALTFPTLEGHDLLLSTFCQVSRMILRACVPLPPSS